MKKRKFENCKGYAIIFSNDSHYIQKSGGRNYSPKSSSSDVAKAATHIKLQAQETRDRPVQIIQNNIV